MNSCTGVQKILGDYSPHWNRKVYVKINDVWNECSVVKILASKLMETCEITDPTPSDLKSDNIVEQIKKSARNDIIGIIVSNKNETCFHSFVLNDNFITDAKSNGGIFDYEDLLSFLENPTQKLWDKMFDCEQFWDGQDINLEILTPFDTIMKPE